MLPEKHGIPHNEQVKAGVHPVPWYISRKLVQKKFFAEYAKERGFSTCLVNWPVSAGADVDINLPMCVPMGYRGDNPRQFYEGVSSPEVLDRYFWKYGYMLCGCNKVLNGSLDDFTNAVAPDIIRDYGQPDVMFVKMCDLDSVRHKLGVNSDTAKLQLEKHDRELGVLMESIRRYGDFENTNFIVMGDHGQTDGRRSSISIGFSKTPVCKDSMKTEGLRHLTHTATPPAVPAGLNCATRTTKRLRERVYRLLLDIRESGKYNIGYVFTKEEAREQFHLTGPFDFIIEGKEPMSFGYDPAAPLFTQTVPGGDYKTSPGTHGGLPWRDHRTTFFACGPARLKKGAVVEQARIVDEAPTMASIFGFEMEDIDGKCLDTLLKKLDKAPRKSGGLTSLRSLTIRKSYIVIYICKGDMTYARCSRSYHKAFC